LAPRYLIIGASGFVGCRLFQVLGRGNAVPTFNRRPMDGGVAFDARTMRLADVLLKWHRGLTHAFILQGVTAIDTCARDPQGTTEINVAGTKRIIDDLLEHGVVPVFASSDAVFDGSRGLWGEDDPANPILTYGRQKVDVERYLLGKSDAALVLRLAKVVAATPGAGDMLGGWLDSLENGQTIRCASDQIFSPVTVDDAADAFVRLAEGGLRGLFHVCGPRPVSRLELLRTLLAEAARYREFPERIVPCSIRDFDFAEPRPFDTSMSPHKLYAVLGKAFEDSRETCRKLAAARYGGRPVSQSRPLNEANDSRANTQHRGHRTEP